MMNRFSGGNGGSGGFPNTQTATLLRSNYHDVMPASSLQMAAATSVGATSRISGASSGVGGGGNPAAVGSGSTLDASAAAVYTNLRSTTGSGNSRPSSMLFNESGFVR